ncbi:hypothetical protein K474DRAFT_133602 [Panus rudis PR-1116 ss-1]|nr:hypothetical protein K474DRAFT_133602 [Panus rudis PR-1116 ss-1]
MRTKKETDIQRTGTIQKVNSPCAMCMPHPLTGGHFRLCFLCFCCFCFLRVSRTRGRRPPHPHTVSRSSEVSRGTTSLRADSPRFQLTYFSGVRGRLMGGRIIPVHIPVSCNKGRPRTMWRVMGSSKVVSSN